MLDDMSAPNEPEGFDYRRTRDGRVFVSWRGRVVTTLQGDEAARLLKRLEAADDRAVQMALAKVTVNFKRGNERRED